MVIQFKNLYRTNDDDVLDEWYIGSVSCDRPNAGDHMIINNEEFEVRTRTWDGPELLIIDLMPLNVNGTGIFYKPTE